MACAQTRSVPLSAALSALLLASGVVWAQAPAPPPGAPPGPMDPVAPVPMPQPALPPGQFPVEPPQPESPVAAPDMPVVPAPAPAPPPPTFGEPAPLPPIDEPPALPSALVSAPSGSNEAQAWYDAFAVSAFADAYAAVDFNFPRARRRNGVRAYDSVNGFSLSWVGVDVQRDAEPVGGVLSLRFGPTAERLGSACVFDDPASRECDSDYGLENVKQGFVSWKPSAPITLDLGKFDTPFGAEVADAQYNLNYTRGVLYWLGQPAYHTGLRFAADLSRSFNLRLLAVNGWNRSIDNNLGKSLGIQGTLRVPAPDGSEDDLVTIALGYMGGPEHDDTTVITCPEGTEVDLEADDGCAVAPGGAGGSVTVDRGSANTKGLRHFVDLTVVATPIPALKLALNGSLGVDRRRNLADADAFDTLLWGGVMAGARYAVDDRVALALRGEYYYDRDGYTTGFEGNTVSLVTGTATLEYSPAELLSLFVDLRLDWSDKQIFPSEVRDLTGTAFSATVGAVVATY